MNDPLFLQTTFEQTARACNYTDALEDLLCNEYIEICGDFDRTHMQESWSWRNTYSAREIVNFLIDQKGELKKHAVIKATRILKEHAHSLGPNRYHDAHRLSHLYRMLSFFSSEKEYVTALKKIYCPESHLSGALQLIRETLLLAEFEPITDAHARKAALSALLTTLRQNVGSCFATAPAIMIQQEQPLQFLADIGQLFGTGRLTRIYEGIEYAVPLSVKWGVGELHRPIHLASLQGDPFKTMALAPGLHAAFIATGLIEKKASRAHRQKVIAQLLKDSKCWLDATDPFATLSADTILKKVFLSIHGVEEKEIKLYRDKPLNSIVTPPIYTDKQRLVERFIRDYEKAKNAFNGLTENALLKGWEFTLASLSESKADFAKWNLYISLGVQVEEPFGIGQSVHQYLQEKVDQINKEIEAYQSRYDHLFAQAKYLEGRMHSVSTSGELEWLRADYRLRQQELNRVLSEQSEVHEKGKKLINLYPFIIDFYGQKIREYFQEIYDAQMHDVSTNPYDDSPAGFRLLYKHGRSNTSLWTMIYTPDEYIHYLSAFFAATEIELRALPEMEGLDKELSELVTTIILTIKRSEFLETSFYRLAHAYKESLIRDPLQHLEHVKRKPWAYISGGTMASLIHCYYGISDQPKEEKRWVENENELLAFLIDTVKERSRNVHNLYQKNVDRSMLAFSPTHAYLCKPGWKLFRQAWESDLYTYTWIRDMWFHPHLNFLDDHILDSRMIDYIVTELLHIIPIGYQPLVKNALNYFPPSMSAYELRESILKTLGYAKWIKGEKRLELIAEELDSILYCSLPLFPEHALVEKLHLIFEALDFDNATKTKLFTAADNLEIRRYTIVSANDLRKIAKALLMRALCSTRSSIAWHQKITEVMQAHQLSYPAPILVGDTNWIKNTFGFTVNPGTAKIEFWRFDDCGSEGRPISAWRGYLNGSSRQEWGLYVTPSQYGQFL